MTAQTSDQHVLPSRHVLGGGLPIATGLNTPVPFAAGLEQAFVPGADTIVAAVRSVVRTT